MTQGIAKNCQKG